MSSNSLLKHLPKGKYLEMLPKLKEERTQHFITLVLTLVTLSLFGLLAINPTLSTISELNKQLDDNIFIDKKLTEKLNSLASLQQKYNVLAPDLPIIYAAVPLNPSLPLLVGEIQAVAKKENVILLRTQTYQVELGRKDDKPNNYSLAAFTVDIEGPYANIAGFLSSLGNLDRIITFDALSISRSPDKNGILLLNIRGKTYFKNDITNK